MVVNQQSETKGKKMKGSNPSRRKVQFKLSVLFCKGKLCQGRNIASNKRLEAFQLSFVRTYYTYLSIESK